MITRASFETLWRHTRNKMDNRSGAYLTSKKLADALGVEYPKEGYFMIMPYDDELVEKLELLLSSPHWPTLLAVLKARKLPDE